jgi:hypothetical protein
VPPEERPDLAAVLLGPRLEVGFRVEVRTAGLVGDLDVPQYVLWSLSETRDF